jgi:serine protease Do
MAGHRAPIVLAVALVLGACGKGSAEGEKPAGLPIGATPPTAPLVLPAAPPTAAPAASVAESLAVPMQPVSFAPIARRADPSVVTINTVVEEVEVSPFTRRRRTGQGRGLGTGFVVDVGANNRVILTNNHVVEGAQSIEVKLSDERTLPAKVVGADPKTDIAVVRIDAKDLPALPLGDSDRLEVGDWVVAIGNPFGLSHTVSAGIVSAKGRTQQDVPLDPSGFYNFLQTDASINPGNSGGPLLNLKGEVVGINSAIRGGGAQGIGFAIPINMVKQILPVLLRDGHFTRSALGVRITDVRDLSKDERQALGLPPVDTATGGGAVVEYVEPGGGADKAGLAIGDVIIGFEGSAIEHRTQLQWLASTAGVGRTVTLRVQREGKVFEVKVTLQQLPELPSAASGPR